MAWADIEPGSDPVTLAIGAAKSEFGLCRQIPGCNIGKDGIWRVPLTWPTYACFKAVWSRQPVTETPELTGWASAKWAEITERYAMRSALDASPDMLTAIDKIELGDRNWAQGMKLSPVQRGAAEWLARLRRGGRQAGSAVRGAPERPERHAAGPGGGRRRPPDGRPEVEADPRRVVADAPHRKRVGHHRHPHRQRRGQPVAGAARHRPAGVPLPRPVERPDGAEGFRVR